MFRLGRRILKCFKRMRHERRQDMLTTFNSTHSGVTLQPVYRIDVTTVTTDNTVSTSFASVDVPATNGRTKSLNKLTNLMNEKKFKTITQVLRKSCNDLNYSCICPAPSHPLENHKSYRSP